MSVVKGLPRVGGPSEVRRTDAARTSVRAFAFPFHGEFQQPVPSGPVDTQSVGQQLDGLFARMAHMTFLQVSYRAGTDGGEVGQLLLGDA
ncbi:hypothetical protein ADL30_09980 [Streptomyces sp. NRRL S-1521]|nr:hypothetical protein ADL30_09980 [Streptomyces sp. NRRL S-1521]